MATPTSGTRAIHAANRTARNTIAVKKNHIGGHAPSRSPHSNILLAARMALKTRRIAYGRRIWLLNKLPPAAHALASDDEGERGAKRAESVTASSMNPSGIT